MIESSCRTATPTQCVLGVFAKYWRPGEVKTRLAISIGPIEASRLYQKFLEISLRRFSTIRATRQIVFTPPESWGEFRAFADVTWQLVAQSTGTLGDRLRNYFDKCFRDGATKVLVLGTDSPDIPLQSIDLGLEALEENDVVLGPSLDGGYYLVGARHSTPRIFDDISWSTSRVWTQTVAALDQLGLRYTSLPPWPDVDDVNDLKRITHRLRSESALDESLQSLLMACELALRSEEMK